MAHTVTVPRIDRLNHKARRRTERRWRAMVDGRAYAYGIPAVDLYVEALRLSDALTAQSVRLMTEPELDALHEATHADLADLARGLEAPVAYSPHRYPAAIADWSELELRSAHGDR